MAMMIQPGDLTGLLTGVFEKQIKPRIVDVLVENQMFILEKEVRKIIEPLVEDLTIDAVQKMAMMDRFGEQLDIKIHWENNDET